MIITNEGFKYVKGSLYMSRVSRESNIKIVSLMIKILDNKSGKKKHFFDDMSKSVESLF